MTGPSGTAAGGRFRRRPAPWLCVLFLLGTTAGLRAQASYRMVLDPGFSSEPMAGNLLAAHRAFYAVENSLLPPLLFPEDEFLPKAGGLLYRLAKTVLVDDIVDHLTILTQHEVFGHGARYREYGSWNNRYHLSLFPPYGAGSGWAQSDAFPKVLSEEENILMTTAGNEANTLLALRLRRVWLERGRINYRETILYSFAAQNLTWYVLRTRFGDQATGDIAEYVSGVNSLHAASGRALSLDDLAWSCLSALLDPFQFYAVIAYFSPYLFAGEEYFDLPLIDCGPFHYLPAGHFGLTPFGVEFYLDNYFRFPSFLLSGHLRVGLPTFAAFFGLGIELSGLRLCEPLNLNARLDVWHQPASRYGAGGEFLTGHEGLGVLAAIGLDLFFSERAGLTAQAGFKTDGFVPGKPLNGGFFFSAGLAFRE